MKKHIYIYLLLIACLCSYTSLLHARETISFNQGWLFKKGPFSSEPAKVVSQWNSKWEEVEIPHTWNAKDMQVKVNSFYEGTGYYKKNYYADKSLQGKRVFLRFEGVGTCTEVLSLIHI